MTRFRPLLASMLALSLTLSAWGQEESAEAAAPEEAAETPPPPPAPKKQRVVSDNLAAALADTMPAYNPPEPEPEKSEEEIAAYERKNNIIRLPKVVVEGERPPIFTEREVNTDKGLEQIAVQRYFGGAAQAMNTVAIPIVGKSNEALAMEMWEEDERLRQMKDFNDRADMEETLGEEEDAEETREMIREATHRHGGPADSVLHRDNTRD